jgi:hypothetical protein
MDWRILVLDLNNARQFHKSRQTAHPGHSWSQLASLIEALWGSVITESKRENVLKNVAVNFSRKISEITNNGKKKIRGFMKCGGGRVTEYDGSW